MVHTIEGVLELDGRVRLLQPIPTTSPRRALVMILEESSSALPSETAILSEPGAPMIVLDRVSLSFDEKVILKEVSFTLISGHTKIVLGASGVAAT